MPSLLEGILLGLGLIFFVGPVFFALIQTSIQDGFKSAASFAFGVSIADICYLLLTVYGFSLFQEVTSIVKWVGLIGGGFLLGFGLYSIYKSFRPPKILIKSVQGFGTKHFLRGLLVNGFNPLVLFFWSGVVAFEVTNYDHSLAHRKIFFLGVLFTMLCGDLSKGFFAAKLKSMMKPNLIRILNWLVGLALIFLGLQMIYLAVTDSFKSVV